MSTLQITPEHLSAIVYGCKKYQVVGSLSTDETWGMMIELLQRNCEEYSDRYPNNPSDVIDLSEFYPYSTPRNAEAISPMEFFKLAQCYQYNSSQAQSWKGSKAQIWTDALMSRAIGSTPEYNAAKWTI